jgi:chorismate-pyruvate lyase
MRPYFASTEFLLSTKGWLTSENLLQEPLASSIKEALEIQGLLTTALEEAYGEPVTVECLRMAEWGSAPELRGLRRDVLIKTGPTVRVTASTLIPAAVLNLHPWLANLGNQPLGESLNSRLAHQRGEFEFKQLDLSAASEAQPSETQPLWVRRYKFSLAGGALLVTETFLPDVLERLGESVAAKSDT